MVFGLFKKKEPPKNPPKRCPPVPDWRPAIVQPIDDLAERFKFYTDGSRDFAVFENGTVVILPSGLDDQAAQAHASQALRSVFYAHPDMNPIPMKDGNVLVQYSNDTANLVLKDIAEKNWFEIDKNHQRALATDEVLITPSGPNTFDDFGKTALFGRCYMFMDAQDPKIVRIVRHEN